MRFVVVASGGIDSTTLLYQRQALGDEVYALGVDYGQRHRRELDALRGICANRGVPLQVADLSGIRGLIAGQSSQTNPAVPVPEGHYADPKMRAAVVPNRNMILISVAIGHALSLGADAVGYGAHAGAAYPDCRRPFAEALAEAARLCDWSSIELLFPFVDVERHDIVKRGAELGVPFKATWSCYKGEELHCGKCAACVRRHEAFDLAGIPDPTEYAS